MQINIREIGIVQFFREYNRKFDDIGDYGFISPYCPLETGRGIHFKERDADISITKDDIVTFRKIETLKGYSAKDVKKLKDDKEVLQHIINFGNEKEYYNLLKFIKGYNYIAYIKFQTEILSGLTSDIIDSSLWILPSLNENQLIQVIKDRYKVAETDYCIIFEKDKAFFEDREEMKWFESYYIDSIPDNVKKCIALISKDEMWAWQSLDADQLKMVINSRYTDKNMDPDDIYKNDKRYFDNLGKMTWFQNNFIQNIPDEIVNRSPLIMDDLPNYRKKNLVKNHLSEGTYEYWDWDKKYLKRLWPELFVLTSNSAKYVDDELYEKFDLKTKLKYCCLIYKAEEDKTKALQMILSLLKESTSVGIYLYSLEEELPDGVLSNEEILKHISFERKIKALHPLYSTYTFNKLEKEAILNSLFLDDMLGSYKEKVNKLLSLDGMIDIEFLRSHWDILSTRYSDATVKFLSKNIKLLLGKNYINDDIKILLLYLMAKNDFKNEEILEITKPENNSNKVAVVRLFYESGQNLRQGKCDKAEELFVKAHEALLSLLQLHDGKIADTKYLFPKCTNTFGKCRYCEAKFWIPKDDNDGRTEYAYCPRTHRKFDLDCDCARIKAKTNLPIGLWSLLEFFEIIGLTGFSISIRQNLAHNRNRYFQISDIDPRQHLSELKDPREYIPRMAGGFNRLYEIKDHLKCRYCGNVMIPSLEFSVKQFAVYMTTRVSCKDMNPEHDCDVYLSHCHGNRCGKIIDSRDDKYQDREGYYICTRCGTAGYHTTAGTLCPNCELGSTNPRMINLGGRRYKCYYCGYEISAPPPCKYR